MISNHSSYRSFLARHWPLALVLLLGLALRLALWDRLPRSGLIGDEAEYLAAADWLAQGRGFAWHQGWLWTRAPLYPLFLAAHLRIFGMELSPIYITQTLLSLLNVGLVYLLALLVLPAARLLPVTAGEAQPAGDESFKHQALPATLAALLTAIYLPFAAYAQMLLSETLYLTLLLSAFVVLGIWQRGAGTLRRSALLLALAGGLLGLASLTRGLTLAFLPLVAGWLWFGLRRKAADVQVKQPIQRARRGGWTVPLWLFAAAFGLVLLPWSLYASRTYAGLVLVDTTGAFNLLLGARTAYDGKRDDAPTRNFVLAFLDAQLTPEQRRGLLEDQRDATGQVLTRGSCLYRQSDPRLLAALERPVAAISQGERQQLMTAEALCLLRVAPNAFATKSLVELVDFFQINYTGAERLSDGFALGRLPQWWTAALLLLDDTLYVLTLPLALLGWALLRQNRSSAALSGLIAFWWLCNLLTAPLLFAINRFRLPLLPFVFICAAWALVMLARGGWRGLRGSYGMACALLAGLLALIAIAPHAYLEPRPPGADARWSSYLGPYPSSLSNTQIAWASRTGYLREQALMNALGRGDGAAARELLATPDLPPYSRAVAEPLLAGLAGDPAQGLALLDQQAVAPLARWQTYVVRGDLLRRLGDESGARAAFTPTFVDDQNPVPWAWNWLYPPPLPAQRIDLGGNLDLGYIDGFYLGEPDRAERSTWRWSGPEARLRFPAAGSGAAQELCLRADGRGWPTDLALPEVRLAMGTTPLPAIVLQRDLREYCVPLPVSSPGADLLVTLHTATFVPPAADLLQQQGPQVGQLRQLGVRLDWAEIRDSL